MSDVDQYIEKVIKQGDEGSLYLAASAAPTLSNGNHVEILEDGMNGLAVLRIPPNQVCGVASIGGVPSLKDSREYAASVVDRAVDLARKNDFIPIGFADVIDSSTGDLEDLKAIQESIIERVNHYKIPIMNGENAILSDRVIGTANITGTIIGICSDERKGFPNHLENPGIAVFHPKGKAVYVNCDGIGTKGEFGERDGTPEIGLADSTAMKVDDLIKVGARFKAMTEGVEYAGEINQTDFLGIAHDLSKKLKGPITLSFEDMIGRIQGYKPGTLATNFSGTSFSTIDEHQLQNPLKPSAGEWLIAIRGEPNPRSNGITERRELMVKRFGREWHQTEQGKLFMPFLKEPSTILYPLFREMIDKGYATSVFHLSGGAYEGKLARPLAKEGLHVKLENLFTPDWRDLSMAGWGFTSAKAAYSKRPMGIDGFVSVHEDNINHALESIQEYGLEGRVVGKLERAQGDKTGVSLTAANDESLYFKGKVS
jgi:phosphoribosylaminoimidazole (AIR) synthetase